MSLGLGESGRQKSTNQFFGQLGTDHARTQTKYISIVVFPALASRKNIVTERRSDTRNLVGSDAGSHATTAQKNSYLRILLQDRLAHGLRVVR